MSARKTQGKRLLWVILATIGACWLIYSSISGYVNYWTHYDLQKNFLNYLISPELFQLVKAALSLAFFTLMIRYLESLVRGFSLAGLGISLVVAVLYAIGIGNSIKTLLTEQSALSFISRLLSLDLAKYVSYGLLLVAMIIFFAGCVRNRLSGRGKRIFTITAACLVYVFTVAENIISASAVTAEAFAFITLADCLAYVAIAMCVYD